MIQRIINLEIIKNRYFVLGSVIGKGVSILALPLIILYFGAHTFALYVLIYSYVQFISLVSILGANNALIPFWLEYEKKEEFLTLLVGLTAAMSAIFYLPIAGLLYYFAPLSADISHPLLTIGLILVYAFVYNLFVIGQALLRVESKQLSYLLVGFASAVLFFTLLLVFRNTTRNGVIVLTLINIAALLFQVILSFKLSDVSFRFGALKHKWATLSRRILKFSAPLTAYMLVGSIPSIVDKWIVHKSFPMTVFAAYTLNFQFAFAVNIISNVINIYNSPRVCALYHVGDAEGLSGNLKTNYILVVLGTGGIGLASFVYASITDISLTVGYWVLVAAFGCGNIFALNTSFIIAEKRTILLGLIGLMGVVVFVAMMIFAVVYDVPFWIYLSQLFSYASLALGSLLAIKINAARRVRWLTGATAVEMGTWQS